MSAKTFRFVRDPETLIGPNLEPITKMESKMPEALSNKEFREKKCEFPQKDERKFNITKEKIRNSLSGLVDSIDKIEETFSPVLRKEGLKENSIEDNVIKNDPNDSDFDNFIASLLVTINGLTEVLRDIALRNTI
jgi:Mg2+ and Co2+ transporter CorA